MYVKQAPDLALKIHPASLNSWPEERALPHLDDCSGHTQAVHMHQTSNTDIIANFQFRHRSTVLKISRRASKIILLEPVRRKGRLKHFNRLQARRHCAPDDSTPG
jgi:hypothetical protein